MWKKLINGIPEAIFKLFMTAALLVAPYFVYKHHGGFEPAVVTALTEILFMCCAILEEILFIRKKKE